jgi:hypothetical protein
LSRPLNLFQGFVDEDESEDTAYLKYQTANKQPVLRQSEFVENEAQYTQ